VARGVFAPVAAGVAAYRYHRAAVPAQPISVTAHQILAAGLLTNVVGALLVTIFGSGTIAAMLTAPSRRWA
jgi:hypothetical protein